MREERIVGRRRSSAQLLQGLGSDAPVTRPQAVIVNAGAVVNEIRARLNGRDPSLSDDVPTVHGSNAGGNSIRLAIRKMRAIRYAELLQLPRELNEAVLGGWHAATYAEVDAQARTAAASRS